MSFILDEQRDADCRLAFASYWKYLAENEDKFPASVYALASSEWWYDFNDKRCPHDSSLVSVQMHEEWSADGEVELTMSIRLKEGETGEVYELTYIGVSSYDLGGNDRQLECGHGGWRYDEFRVGDDLQVLHEVEWGDGARWLIQCQDIDYRQILSL